MVLIVSPTWLLEDQVKVYGVLPPCAVAYAKPSSAPLQDIQTSAVACILRGSGSET